MSADDATARRLDQQLDELIANGGELPAKLVGDDVARVAHLFLVDAANLEMENERAVRRQLLEQIALDEQAGARRPRVRVPRPGRTYWRVKRVALVSMCVLVACTTVAVADTKSPAGRAMRSAARAFDIPVPAEPQHRSPQHEAKPPKRTGDRPAAGDKPDAPAPTGTPRAATKPSSGDDTIVEGEAPLAGRAPLPDGEGNIPPPPDGQAPKPSDDAQYQPPPDGQLPPPDGTAPKPPAPAPKPKPGATAPAPAPCCDKPLPPPPT